MSFSKCFKASIFACSVAFTTAARIDDGNSGLRGDDQNHDVAFVQSAKLDAKEPGLSVCVEDDETTALGEFEAGHHGVLIWAARLGKLDFLKMLFESHPNIITMEGEFDGKMVAYYAAAGGHLNVLKWIEQNGDAQVISATDNKNRTVAHYAANGGHLNVLKWIEQKYGAQLISATDFENKTVAHYAARRGKLGVLQWIEQEHAQLLSVTDNEGRTPTHHAAQYRRRLSHRRLLVHSRGSVKAPTPR